MTAQPQDEPSPAQVPPAAQGDVEEAPPAAEDPETGAIIHALLQRSRQLGDARFQLPMDVYRRYLLLSGQETTAPTPWIVERAVYRVLVDKDRRPSLECSLTLNVLEHRPGMTIPVFWSGRAWKHVFVPRLEVLPKAPMIWDDVKLPAVKEFLQFSPPRAGRFDLQAVADLPAEWLDGSPQGLPVPVSTRTAVEVQSPLAWSGSVSAAVVGESANPAPNAPARQESAVDQQQGAPQPMAAVEFSGLPQGGTKARVILPPTDIIHLSLQPAVARRDRPPRFELRGDVAWNIDAAVQQVDADLDVTIAGGPSERIALELDGRADRVRIEGPAVREVQAGGGTAEIALRGPTLGRVGLRVSYELPLGQGGQHGLGGLAVRGGHWAGGTLVVTNSAGGSELLATRSDGLKPIPMSSIPGSARAILHGTPALAYDISGREFSAAVEAVNLGEFALRQSIADLAQYELFLSEDGDFVCRVRYEVRNRTRQFLRLDLPRDASIVLARVNEKSVPVSPALAPGGGRASWLLPLERSRPSVIGLVSFPVEIVYMCKVGGLSRASAATASLPLPAIDLPVAYAWAQSYLPNRMKIRTVGGALKRVQQFTSQTAKASLDYGSAELAEGYREQDRPTTPATPPMPGLNESGIESDAVPDVSRIPNFRGPRIEMGRVGIQEGRHIDLAQVGNQEGVQVMDQGGTANAPGPRLDLRRVGGQAGLYDEEPPPADIPPGNLPAVAVTRSGSGRLVISDRSGSMSDTWGGNAYVGGTRVNAGWRSSSNNNIGGGTNTYAGDGGFSSWSLSQNPQALLGRNYYRAGKDFYDKGDYANAWTNLEKALDLAPDTPEADNARRLLGNRKALGSSSLSGSTSEKAAALEVRKEAIVANAKMEMEQKALVEEGLQEARSGKGSKAMSKLKAAQSLGKQLAAQYADQSEQQAVMEKAAQELVQLQKKQQDEVQELREKLEDYKSSGSIGQAIDVARKMIQMDDVDQEAARKELESLIVAQARQDSQARQQSQAGPQSEIANLYSRQAPLENRTPPVPPTSLRPLSPVVSPASGGGMGGGGGQPRQGEAPAGTRGSDQPRGQADGEGAAPANEAESLATVEFLQDQRKASEEAQREQEKGMGPAGRSVGHRPVQDLPQRTVTRVYDIRDMIAHVPNFKGPRIELSQVGNQQGRQAGGQGGLFEDDGRAATRPASQPAGEKGLRSRDELIHEIAGLVTDAVDPQSWRGSGGRAGQVRELDGQLVITQTEDNQRAVGNLIEQLRQARGPAVERGERLSRQRAANDVDYDEQIAVLTDGTWEANGDGAAQRGGKYWVAPPVNIDKALTGELTEFARRNYDWASVNGTAGGNGTVLADLARNLQRNLGQKVPVNSINVNADSAMARRLGARFHGAPGRAYALLDEAQVRSLLELDADNARLGRTIVQPNGRLRETLVGTGAYLANGMVADLAFGADKGNNFVINGDVISLPHEQVLAIDNGGYLTLVRAGAIQHWREKPSAVDFAQVPQQIDVPRVGQQVLLEKTLLEPTDTAEVRVEYQWE